MSIIVEIIGKKLFQIYSREILNHFYAKSLIGLSFMDVIKCSITAKVYIKVYPTFEHKRKSEIREMFPSYIVLYYLFRKRNFL